MIRHLLLPLLVFFPFINDPVTTHYQGTIGSSPILLSIDRPTDPDSSPQMIEATVIDPVTSREQSFKGSRQPYAHKEFSLEENQDFPVIKPQLFELKQTDDNQLIGVRICPDLRKSLPVSLTPIAKTIQLISTKTDEYQIATGYLKFIPSTPFHDALNQALELDARTLHDSQLKESLDPDAQSAMNGDDTPLSMLDTPYILYHDNSLVSIRIDHSEYAGGAHENYTAHSLNFAWINGKLIPLTNADLIDPARMKQFADTCVQNLKNYGAPWPEGAEFKKDFSPTLNFSDQGLFVTYNPYQVDCFAAGFRIVALPWNKVRQFMPANSPLLRLTTTAPTQLSPRP